MRFIPALADMVAYEPGLPLELVMARYGLDRVVKLASNEFPLPPFPAVKEAVVAALDDLNRYPDGHCTALREALAAHYGRRPEQVIVGNGSCELLMLLGDALLEAGDAVVFADPSFVVYGDICRRHRARAVTVPLVDFSHDLEAMAAAVTPRTKMVIVCNPNNPTGTYVPTEEVAALAAALPDDVLLVVDEAYNEFVTRDDRDGCLALQAGRDNVVVLRTFSKIYGLCGLRVGYGLCSPAVHDAVEKLRQPFNVNRLAQVAATEALRHQDEVARRREANARVRARMVAALAERGLATVPSEANFMLVQATGLAVSPERVFEELLRRGVIVRDGASLGCPGWIRVSVGTEEETEVFLAAMDALRQPASGLEGRSV
jgi:histidinol-phosphate aminotransferase